MPWLLFSPLGLMRHWRPSHSPIYLIWLGYYPRRLWLVSMHRCIVDWGISLKALWVITYVVSVKLSRGVTSIVTPRRLRDVVGQRVGITWRCLGCINRRLDTVHLRISAVVLILVLS